MYLKTRRRKMSESRATASVSGIGFGGLLTILFIGLKLTHFIDWPWVWVLFPLWGPVVSILVIFALAALIMIIAALMRR